MKHMLLSAPQAWISRSEKREGRGGGDNWENPTGFILSARYRFVAFHLLRFMFFLPPPILLERVTGRRLTAANRRSMVHASFVSPRAPTNPPNHELFSFYYVNYYSYANLYIHGLNRTGQKRTVVPRAIPRSSLWRVTAPTWRLNLLVPVRREGRVEGYRGWIYLGVYCLKENAGKGGRVATCTSQRRPVIVV